jgi:hypothetical protein
MGDRKPAPRPRNSLGFPSPTDILARCWRGHLAARKTNWSASSKTLCRQGHCIERKGSHPDDHHAPFVFAPLHLKTVIGPIGAGEGQLTAAT